MGIVRKIDELGRIVIPKEIRDRLFMNPNRTPLEMFVRGNEIVMKEYTELCIFCGRDQELGYYKGRTVCNTCLQEMYDKYGR